MHALIAFAIGPIGRYVVIAVLGIMLVFGALWKAEQDGAAKHQAIIERANQKARDAADRARLGPDQCQGNWNRDTGKCDK